MSCCFSRAVARQEAFAEGAAAAAGDNAEQHAGDGAAAAPEAAVGVEAAVANGSDNPGHSNPGVEGAHAAAHGFNISGHGQDLAHAGARIRHSRNSCIGHALITPPVHAYASWVRQLSPRCIWNFAELCWAPGWLMTYRHLLRHGRW